MCYSYSLNSVHILHNEQLKKPVKDTDFISYIFE